MPLYVMKFGGNAIRGKEDTDRFANEVSSLVKEGASIVLVHGGGPEITAEIEKRGMVTTMVSGFRITDEGVLNVAEEVLKGLNCDVTDSLKKAGVSAKGMAGYENGTIGCVKKDKVKVKDGNAVTEVDLGLVGEVSTVNTEHIKKMLSEGIIPVIYPICAGPAGIKMNVNADTVASGIAANTGCNELVFITDVPGILSDVNDKASKIDNITLNEIDDMIASGAISGGMIPKVEACRKAILSGAAAVRMVSGKDKGPIVSGIMSGSPRGTRITK